MLVKPNWQFIHHNSVCFNTTLNNVKLITFIYSLSFPSSLSYFLFPTFYHTTTVEINPQNQYTIQSLDQSLQVLEDYLHQDSSNIYPPHIKSLLQISKHTLTDSYIPSLIPQSSTFDSTMDSSSSQLLSNPQQSHLTSTTSRSDGLATPLIPEDNSLTFSQIEQRINKVSQLLTLLTNISLVQHPLCPKCSHDLNVKIMAYSDKLEAELENMLIVQEQLLPLFSNKKKLSSIPISSPLSHTSTNPSIIPPNLPQSNQRLEQQFALELANSQLTQLSLEEQSLLQELQLLQNELQHLDEEETQLVEYSSYLHTLENNYLGTFFDLKSSISQYLQLTRTLQAKLDKQQRLHDTLSLSNALYDIMMIDFASPIPSISGFRLGRNDDTPVDWFEINAGLGQMCLLIEILRKTFNLSFKNTIILYPLGHRSYVSRDSVVTPLFKDSTESIDTESFKSSCRVLLQCIQELFESQIFFITPTPANVLTPAPQSKSRNSIQNDTSDFASNQGTGDAPLSYQPLQQYIVDVPIGDENDLNNPTQRVLQQPQYNTVVYAQKLTKEGQVIVQQMTHNIQPPSIQYSEGNASINGCVLDPEDISTWLNAMRQFVIALYQLMLIAIQRGL